MLTLKVYNRPPKSIAPGYYIDIEKGRVYRKVNQCICCKKLCSVDLGLRGICDIKYERFYDSKIIKELCYDCSLIIWNTSINVIQLFLELKGIRINVS